MNKPELVARIADKTNYTKKQVEEITAALFDVITEALIHGDKAVISGFGTFEVHERAKKTGRNPQTGEEILIEGSKAPVFKSAKVFKDAVNKR
ncbi:MAG: HU family DNA-binding protein [Anaeroplasmataceae bacterium]|nr:HU family DNA-binding protein [Anaeroplasmataceae bacterium]MDE7385005.1 HU family DNA-binding protein [Anaeroplasmataceae bacterium]